MGHGQYNNQGKYCSPHTASSVFLTLIFQSIVPRFTSIFFVECLTNICMLLLNSKVRFNSSGQFVSVYGTKLTASGPAPEVCILFSDAYFSIWAPCFFYIFIIYVSETVTVIICM